jgi:membrane peptidoglycan carboxypeptidase
MSDIPLNALHPAAVGLEPAAPPPDIATPPKARKRPLHIAVLLWTARLTALAMVAGAVYIEAHTSYVESFLLARVAKPATYSIGIGPSEALQVPPPSPYDDRLGYSHLGAYVDALTAHHFVIERQARLSPELAKLSSIAGYPIYREKSQAGVTLLDRTGAPLYESIYPEQAYPQFAAIPPILVDSLLFVEDQNVLDQGAPHRNPAIDWKRFPVAAAAHIAGHFDPRIKDGGASTLATQIEKFRHWPGGRTGTAGDKLRQMAMASLRAYSDGPDTMAMRRDIVTTYLNSTPLSSRAGYGEIIGVPEGLHAWYGSDYAEVSQALTSPARSEADLARKARLYKQALSLILAERRPSYYLATDHDALRKLTDNYLGLLAAAGVIDRPLAEAALRADLPITPQPPAPAPVSFVARKAADALRTELLTMLKAPNLYSVDRLDLTAQSTLDADAQGRVAGVLSKLADRQTVQDMGMVGKFLLGDADPAKVTYSVVLYERGQDRNFVRVHADSGDEPFDVNSGAKLILGSTAKLRTMITYLNIMSGLRDRFDGRTPAELEQAAASAQDPLTRWAATYLAGTSDHRLQPMLDAAMRRQYSGSTQEVFFTGGGDHVFHNFEKKEDFQVYSVEDAFENSVNLSFVRIMRDIVRYEMAQAQGAGEGRDLLADRHDAEREVYLRRFADQEGQSFLNHFYDDYHGRSPDEALTFLASRTRPVPKRLAVVFRTARPKAGVEEMREFIRRRLPGETLSAPLLEQLYRAYDPAKFGVNDRGYLAGIHPLELWLVAYLQEHPDATRAEIAEAAGTARQEAYSWLYKTPNKRAQDTRIRILLEEDAFARILQDWKKQGYPFGHLVPSYATAIGSSGDRPDALAELMGIIVNDGVRLPSDDIERLSFAKDTPYETDFAFAPRAPERVLAPEVAATARRALMGVVANGTGNRVRNVFYTPDGKPIAIGGKTGTGDNRFDKFGPGGAVIESRPVDRTATFVFFLGDKFYGTITAYVRGKESGDYHFTSALAVQLLKSLSPDLRPLLGTAPAPVAALRTTPVLHPPAKPAADEEPSDGSVTVDEDALQ